MMASPETVTILFTDLVNSTELLEELGDAGSQRVLAVHHANSTRLIEQHAGSEVKWLGDGVMAAFPSALSAARCAVALQQSARRPIQGARLTLRVALHTGEALHTDGDFSGAPVVIASRLCHSAAGGQVVTSDVTASMIRTSREFELRDLAGISLKGFASPVQAVEIHVEFDPRALLRHMPVVGPDRELSSLRKKFESAVAGEGSIALLAGEPGIGKTRLAEDLGEYAMSVGGVVFAGACYERQSHPYQPFLEALRDAVPRPLPAELAPYETELDAFDPAAGWSTALNTDESARYRLFEGVTALIRLLSRIHPVLLVLDDLHWADKASLFLLRHLAHTLPDLRVLIVAAYRDIDPRPADALAETVAELRRSSRCEKTSLAGLPEAMIEQLLFSIDPSDANAGARRALAGTLQRQTDGNPFFIREALSMLVEEGKIARHDGHWVGDFTSVGDLGISAGVRDVIARRLARLSDDCRALLTRSATTSRGVTWAMLSAISNEPEDRLLDLLDEALAARVLVETSAGISPRYDFAHALIRETLYESLSAPRRALLHRHVGDALERLWAPRVDEHLSDLAEHFLLADGDAERATGYGKRAADQAMRRAAWEEAAQLYERAVRVIELHGIVDPELLYTLLHGYGQAMRMCRNWQEARSAGLRAWEVARQLQAADRMADAALLVGSATLHPTGQVDAPAVEMLQSAAEALGPTDSVRRSLVLAQLGRRLRWANSPGEAERYCQEAIDIARRVGDSDALGQALVTWHGLAIRPDNLEERRLAAADAMQLAGELADPLRQASAHFAYALDLLETGDIAEVDAQIQELIRIGERYGSASVARSVAQLRSTRALLDGRLADAERLAQEMLIALQQAQDPDALGIYALQLFSIRREQGKLAEVEPLVRAGIDQNPSLLELRSLLAVLLSDTRQEQEARNQFEILAADDFAHIRPQANWLSAMCAIATVCGYLDDTVRAAVLYNHLIPYGARNPVTEDAISPQGSVWLHLGILATTLARFDDADRHFSDATSMNEAMGARAFVARTQFHHAEMLLRRGLEDDRGRARTLVEQARSAARDLGMRGVLSDSEALLQAW